MNTDRREHLRAWIGVAAVAAAVIGIFALPYLLEWLSPPTYGGGLYDVFSMILWFGVVAIAYGLGIFEVSRLCVRFRRVGSAHFIGVTAAHVLMLLVSSTYIYFEFR